MRKTLSGALLVCGLALGASQLRAQETHAAYVNACKTQLGFQTNEVPDLDCYDGDLFDTLAPAFDYVGYRKINEQVDLTFACRWFGGSKTDRRPGFSVEVNIHNRINGNTCFFSAKGTTAGMPSKITSVTSAQAGNFYHEPAVVDRTVRCIGCHVSGPYIASPKIAPFLAKYGLLNNWHDTLSNMTLADLPLANPNVHAKYHAVGSTFAQWDKLRNTYIHGPHSADCSMSCHMLGTASPQTDIDVSRAGTLLAGPVTVLGKIFAAGVMPPDAEHNHYRWVNLDTPTDGSETENFAIAKGATTTLVPKLLNNCAAPVDLEAHAVGVAVENSFTAGGLAMIPDRLKSFNLKDGLVCLNADQPGGACRDYDVSYLCSSGTWSPFYNRDTNLNDDGDHEERNGLGAAFCGSAPVGIQARVQMPASGGTIPMNVFGPNDRLARFSRYGLTCNNADQPDGQCSNYVVRHRGCTTAPITSPAKRLISAFTGRQLTATGTANNALTKGQPSTPGWNTQTWDLVPVPNTEYVRLRNTGTNTYLNATTIAEGSTVGTHAFNDGFTSQQWTVEPVANSNEVRLKNLWSGRYLTIADVPASQRDFAPIYSQGFVQGWSSQRWIIQ